MNRATGKTLRALCGLALACLPVGGYAAGPGVQVSLSATPGMVGKHGSTTLAWSSSNADTCSAVTSDGWMGPVPLSGSASVTVDAETTYTLTCAGAGGSASQSVTVRLLAPEECFFNWAEKLFPNWFAPQGAATQASGPYTYRYYRDTGSYLGVSSVDQHLYYLGPGGGDPVDVGVFVDWLVTAGCN
jgi:hypothetical protein